MKKPSLVIAIGNMKPKDHMGSETSHEESDEGDMGLHSAALDVAEALGVNPDKVDPAQLATALKNFLVLCKEEHSEDYSSEE